MTWVTYAAIYFVAWFIVLLAVLPFGAQRVDNPEPGHDAGAPAHHYMWQKALATTLIAGIVTAGFWAGSTFGWVSFRP